MWKVYSMLAAVPFTVELRVGDLSCHGNSTEDIPFDVFSTLPFLQNFEVPPDD